MSMMDEPGNVVLLAVLVCVVVMGTALAIAFL